MRELIFATVLFCSFLTGAGTETTRQLSSEGEQAHFQPDLNLLRKRVSEFWGLRMTNSRRKAVEYVEPESQDNFLNRDPLPPVESFRILEVDLSDEDPRVAAVTIGVAVQPLGVPAPLQWKVRDQYVYQDDNWFAVISKPRAMEFFRSAEDRRRVESRPEPGSEPSRLKLLPHSIGLDEVRPGSVLEQEISCQNQGEHSLTIRVDSAPAWVGVDKSLFRVEPGGEGRLKLAVFTGSLDGHVSGTVYLTVTGGQAGQVSEEKKLLLSMEVVSPLVVTPRALLLHGGSRHELRLRNNTDRELEIREIIVPGEFLKVERSSETEGRVPARGYLDLPVRWYPEKTPEDWAGGKIELVLKRPLPSGSSSITVSALRVP